MGSAHMVFSNSHFDWIDPDPEKNLTMRCWNFLTGYSFFYRRFGSSMFDANDDVEGYRLTGNVMTGMVESSAVAVAMLNVHNRRTMR